MTSGEHWSPALATDTIRRIASSDDFSLAYTLHAKEQMSARNIIISDVLFVLKKGFVLEEGCASTRQNFFKYAMENKTPNSASRNIRLIVIPDENAKLIKVVTVMWVDETANKAGTILS